MNGQSCQNFTFKVNCLRQKPSESFCSQNTIISFDYIDFWPKFCIPSLEIGQPKHITIGPHIAQVQRTLEYLVPHCRKRKSESDAGYVPVDSLKDSTPN